MNHYQAITNLQHRFIEDLDRRRFHAVAALFGHATLTMTIPGWPEELSGTGEHEIASMLQSAIPPGPVGSFGRHIVTNLIIDLDGDAGSAIARMYTTLIHIAEGKALHLVGVGRHHDELKLIDGEWWFTRKSIVGDARFPRPDA